MGVAIVIHAMERSILESSAVGLTVARITAAFRNAERGIFTADGVSHSRGPDNGGWYGPAPRITRQAPFGSFVTQATWVWVLNDAQQATSGLASSVAQQAFAARLAADVATSLHAMGGSWTVTHEPYSDAINGPLSWWSSGAAAHDVVFINNFPALFGRLEPDDNPIGPNNPLAQGAGGNPHTNPLGSVAWIVGGLAVLVVAVQFGPAIASWVPRKPEPKTEPKQINPRRR